MASNSGAGAAIVKEFLNKQNYPEWSVRMKNYLLAQDLWDVVNPSQSESGTSSDPEINVQKQKNAKAFDAILASCGREAKNLIQDCSSAEDSARESWNTLASAYNSDGYDPQYHPLYMDIRTGDWDKTKEFINAHPEALTAKISTEGYTPLHAAAAFKHLHIVEGLVELMSEEDLELKDIEGFTPLIWLCHIGTTKMAESMVNKNKNLLTIPSPSDYLPVTVAVITNNMEVARYLYSATPSEVLSPRNGPRAVSFLMECVTTKSLDMALHLLNRCPELAITPNHNGASFVKELAMMPSVFPSGSQLGFFQKRIYNWIKVEYTDSVNGFRIDVPNSNTRESENSISLVRGLIDWTVLTFHDLSGIDQIYKTKLIHMQSQELLRIICDQIKTLKHQELGKHNLFDLVLEAAKYGIHEFIVELIKAQPRLAWSCNDNYRNFFYSAIQYRQAKVFSMIYGYIWKDQAANTYNKNRFTLLHMAGKLAPLGQLNCISGAVLQMQRELQWFKEVESIMPAGRKRSTNNDGVTAKDLFIKEHRDLVKEGEKWMKGTATSCTVVGALIVTIMFAVAFTVPGGNNQDTGYPIFKNKDSFMIFIISDVISFFSSSTSVLMFLGILTSRYGEDDFLKSLPTKLIIGLSLLFISIATMMATFCAALFIMLEGKKWIIAPVILLASVPIGLFAKLQFPLLIEIFMSTFGPGIFNRKCKDLALR